MAIDNHPSIYRDHGDRLNVLISKNRSAAEVLAEIEIENDLGLKGDLYMVFKNTRKPSMEFDHWKEITDFFFLLKPKRDHHARVALAAYIESVKEENPKLAEDLKGAMDLL